MRSPRHWRLATWVAWLAVIPLLVWALRDIRPEAVWVSLSQLRAWQILALLVINTVILALFTLRWWLIVNALGTRTSLFSIFKYRLAAFAVNYFTPGPQIGGEPLQVFLLNQKEGVPAPTAIAAVTLDKLLELVINLGFVSAGLLIVFSGGILPGLARPGIFAAILGLMSVFLAYLFALWRGCLVISRFLESLLFHATRRAAIQKVYTYVYSSERQVHQFCRNQPTVFFRALSVSLLAWSVVVIEFWITLNFLGLRLDLARSIAILTAARLAFMAPAPAGLGALEASLVFAFRSLGLDLAFALSLSLIIRARDVCLGLLGLWLGSRAIYMGRGIPFETIQDDHGMIDVSEQVCMKPVTVHMLACARIPTIEGEFQLCLYSNTRDQKEHLALVMGQVRGKKDVLVRLHSECFTGDVLGSKRCDCGEQLHRALQLIAQEGEGVLLYLRQEGRGIGLLDKLRAYNLQDEGYDTVDANLVLGHQADERDYSVAASILHDLGMQSVRLVTNNPDKINNLLSLGVQVTERVSLESTVTPENARYLLTKAQRMKHLLNPELIDQDLSQRKNGSD